MFWELRECTKVRFLSRGTTRTLTFYTDKALGLWKQSCHRKTCREMLLLNNALTELGGGVLILLPPIYKIPCEYSSMYLCLVRVNIPGPAVCNMYMLHQLWRVHVYLFTKLLQFSLFVSQAIVFKAPDCLQIPSHCLDVDTPVQNCVLKSVSCPDFLLLLLPFSPLALPPPLTARKYPPPSSSIWTSQKRRHFWRRDWWWGQWGGREPPGRACSFWVG